jgi:hypothetical protein
MSYFLLAFVIQIIAIGAIAQKWKGHSGVLWALVTAILDGAVVAFLLVVGLPPEFVDHPAVFRDLYYFEIDFLRLGVFTLVPVTIIMLLAIAGWPRRASST